MGAQSSRLYFDGKDHKEIYYQGKYHTAMYKGDQLVWAKTDVENVNYPPVYPVYFKEIGGKLYGINENGYIWFLGSDKTFAYYDSVSAGITAHWVGDNALFQMDRKFTYSTSSRCFISYDINAKKYVFVATITSDQDISSVSEANTNWRHEAAYIGNHEASTEAWSYDAYVLASLGTEAGNIMVEKYTGQDRVDAYVQNADSTSYSPQKHHIYSIAEYSKGSKAYGLGTGRSWYGTSTNVYELTLGDDGYVTVSRFSTENLSFTEYADIDIIDDYLLIYGTGTKGQIYVMNLTTQENWYCGENQEYKGFYRILKKSDSSYYLLESNSGWITIYKSSDMKVWKKIFHDDGLVFWFNGIYSAIFFGDDLYICANSTQKCRVLRIKGI